MTYALELTAIETWLDGEWATAEPTVGLGLAGHDFTPVADSLQLDVLSGMVLQGTIGQSGSNRHDHVGVVRVNIYTEGGKGDQAWRGYFDTLNGILKDKRLKNDGTEETGTGEFIRFSPKDQHPYPLMTIQAAPLQITTIYAPFVRYGTG